MQLRNNFLRNVHCIAGNRACLVCFPAVDHFIIPEVQGQRGIIFFFVTMDEVLQLLHEEYQWSRSLSNFSAKLSRGTLRYTEAIQIADILGYDVIWKKRGDR